MTEFEQIYKLYFREVEAYLLALSKDPHLAEELTQQVFFKALKGIESFRGECDIRLWLCRIGKNCYLDYLRKQRPTESIDEIVVADQNPGIEELTMQHDQSLTVHRILHTLPEPYREVFSLRVFSQLSFSEIAEIFGRNQNWACVTYHRARQKIKDALEGQE